MQGNEAAIYVRVSTTGQEAGTSLDTQEAACRAFAAQLGLNVAHVFQETYTGVEYFDRPAMSELRQMMRDRRVSHVVFYVVDRVSRGGIYAALLHREARDIGIQLYAAYDRWVTPMDDAGELMMYLHGWQAGGEWRQIQERATRARQARPTYGAIPTGRKPRYGYKWADLELNGKVHRAARYVLNEPEADVMQWVFGLFASGMPTLQIIAQLAERGVTSPNGNNKWCSRTITKLIADPIYKGEPIALKTRTERLPGGKKRQVEIEGTPVPGAAPAIVDAATWATANARLKINKQEASRNLPNPEDFLLRAGFIICGVCGKRMTCSGSRGYRQYKCQNGCRGKVNISATMLDRELWSLVVRRLSQESQVRAELERYLANDPVADDLARIERTRKDTSMAIHNTTAAIEKAESSAVIDALVARLEVHAQRIRELDAERAAMIARSSDVEAIRVSLDNLEEWCRRVAINAHQLSYEERRQMLRLLGIQVEAFPMSHEGPRWIPHADVDLTNFANPSICAPVCG